MAVFLRKRADGQVERARSSDRYCSEEKSNALTKLSGVVVVVRHPYERCSFSGAGNCWCGRAKNSPLHDVVMTP
jgi:hypothetical protein